MDSKPQDETFEMPLTSAEQEARTVNVNRGNEGVVENLQEKSSGDDMEDLLENSSRDAELDTQQNTPTEANENTANEWQDINMVTILLSLVLGT